VNVCVDVLEARTGRRLSRERGHNLTVNAGLNLLRDFLANEAPGSLTHFAIGTDATAPASTDTQLVAELLRDQLTARVKTDLAVTLSYYLAANQGNGNTLREAGLFTAANTLFARYVLSSPITKTGSIAVRWTWQLTLSVA